MLKIIPVSETLKDAGLNTPKLNLLVPNEENYTALLMQPQGQIEITPNGVRNWDQNIVKKQYSSFLKDARKTDVDLVITPEYSMPWETLVNSIKTGVVPEPGKLWVIGCESIKYSELEDLRSELSPYATMLFEFLHADHARFMDPLAYVFLSSMIDNSSDVKIVVLVQFKTYAMGDSDHFEANGMQKGTCIYQFGGTNLSLKLISIICSDAFEFLDNEAEAIYDRALVIHLQLTPKPRHEQYRMYKDRLLRFQGDETELICLNWARNVEEHYREVVTPWNNISASAWYIKSDKFDDRDATLVENHIRGLYYTWLRALQVHALFFNYQPGVFLLQATKVAHIGVPAAVSRRRGPQLTKAFIWDAATNSWVEQTTADNGFKGILAESDNAKVEIERIYNRNPFELERVLALCDGKIAQSIDWYKVRCLDSCAIDFSEIIHRITFCQDTDVMACEFRVSRLKRCGRLWNILNNGSKLPPSLSDFKEGFQFEWSLIYPHQNAISASNKRATVIYMSEDTSQTEIEIVSKKAAEYLNQWFKEPDKSHDARQRLSIWYRDQDDQTVLYVSGRFTRFDNPGNTSEFDIGRDA